MEQEGDQYRSNSGQKGGAVTTAAWTKADPKNVGKKNATTGEQQAEVEVKNRYKKQLKSGYFQNESDIDKEQFFQPMLASTEAYAVYKPKLKDEWNKGIAVQIKYNGERMILKKSGAWSRTGERFHCVPHIEEAFQAFFDKFPDAILDGEAFNYDMRERLNEIHSLMSQKTPTPAQLAESKQLIRFYIYDGFGFPTGRGCANSKESDDYLIRKQAIDNAFFAPCFKDRYKDVVGFVPTHIVHSEAELEKLYLSFLDDKQEGAILRLLGIGYQRKRCNFLRKYKPVDDEEYRVVKVQDGVGKDANLLSTITCEKLDRTPFGNGDLTFDAKFKGKQADARKAWKDGTAQSLPGKVVTITFNGKTAYGKPNYPRLDWNNYNKHN